VCPEHIKITDNAIIPLKERVADRYYDPIRIAWRKFKGAITGTEDGAGAPGTTRELPVVQPDPAPADGAAASADH
jgi:hypothetical protein